MPSIRRQFTYPAVLTAVMFVLSGFGIPVRAADPPLHDWMNHQQRVELARKLMSLHHYRAELGILDDPYQYASLSDAEVQRLQAEAVQQVTAANKTAHQAKLALEKYERELITQGKTNRANIKEFTDPSGRLETLRQTATKRQTEVGQALVKQIDLTTEAGLRKNPNRIIQAEKDLQIAMRHGREISAYMRQKVAEAEQKAQGGQRSSGSRTGSGGSAGSGSSMKDTVEVFKISTQSQDPSVSAGQTVQLAVTYGDLYGPGKATVSTIEAFEAEAYKALPAEMRHLPKNVQRLFIYGGYEQLPKEVRKHIRYVSKNSSADKVEQIYRATQHLRPPPILTASGQQRAQAINATAWLMVSVIQGLANYVYERDRKIQLERAIQKAASQIPAGETEEVTLIERVEEMHADLYHWWQTRSVEVLHAKLDLRKQGEVLDDLRRSGALPWHQRRMYTVSVTGTGEKIGQKPSMAEAFKAGYEIGRVYRGGKGSREMMRKIYPNYNQWEDIRQEFLRGYRAGTSGTTELPE